MTKEKKKRLELIIGSQEKKKRDAAAKLKYALTTRGLVIF